MHAQNMLGVPFGVLCQERIKKLMLNENVHDPMFEQRACTNLVRACANPVIQLTSRQHLNIRNTQQFMFGVNFCVLFQGRIENKLEGSCYHV
jgi:hypothetical protein